MSAKFLGLDQEKAISAYFRRHYGHFFPAPRSLHRTTLTRQAANLRQMKPRLWRKVLGHTLFVGLCRQYKLLPLRMAELFTN